MSTAVRLRSISRPLVPCPGREQKRFQSGNASANDAHVGFDGRPEPDLESMPRRIIRPKQDIMDPVRPEAACDDNDAADAKEDDEADALSNGK